MLQTPVPTTLAFWLYHPRCANEVSAKALGAAVRVGPRLAGLSLLGLAAASWRCRVVVPSIRAARNPDLQVQQFGADRGGNFELT